MQLTDLEHFLGHWRCGTTIFVVSIDKNDPQPEGLRASKIQNVREMSYESFSKIIECSHQMIEKEVQNNFVPRKELFKLYLKPS